MKVIDLHPEELIDKMRAGTLTADERERLDKHLATSSQSRFLIAVTNDFEEDEAERTPNPKSITAALGALQPVERPAERGAGRRLRALLLVAAVLVGGVAVAAAATGVFSEEKPAPPEESTPPAAPAETEESPLRGQAGPAPSESEPEEEVAPLPEPSAAPPAPSAVAPKAPTAAQLFSRANQARRSGDTKRAIALYRELQTRHPKSEEAKTASIVLGSLLMEDKPEGALEEYDRYLGKKPSAASEEALVGRAQSLERLGRKPEARAAWQELLSRYPNSVHAGRARARIQALSAE